MPLILVILDGMTEQGVTEHKPFVPTGCETLVHLVQEGGFGLLSNTPNGLPVDSLTCIATLLGVPAAHIPVGRAYLEALAAGLSLQQGDAVCRLNLTSLDAAGNLVGSSNILSTTESRELCTLLSDNICQAFHLAGYKNLMIMRGGEQEANDIQTYPPHQHPNEAVLALLPQGGIWGERLRKIAIKSRITKNDIDYLLFPWDVSVRPELPLFSQLHGLHAACVCKTEIVHGLCLAMAIDVCCPSGATAESDTNFAVKVEAALRLAKQYDVVIVHVNGADELAHRCDAQGKADFLRRADAELLTPLANGLPNGGRLLVCCDHATSVKSGRHEGGTQPFVLWQKGKQSVGWLGNYLGEQAIQLLVGNVD